MRAVVKRGPHGGMDAVEVAEVSDPAPGQGDVLVDLIHAGICHTDTTMAEGQPSALRGYRPAYPLVLGHEFVGRIGGLGEGVAHSHPRLTPGQRVVGSAHVTCRHCTACRSRRSMLCPSLRVLGLDRDGVFAERFTVPAVNVVPLPDDIPDEVAALSEPFAVAAHAVDVAGLTPGAGGTAGTPSASMEERAADVAVVGPGAVGLLTVGALAGHRVTVVGTPTDSRQLAMARRLGARTAVTDGDEAAPGSFDAVIETAGSSRAVTSAVELCRPGGRVVCVGLPSDSTAVDTAALARTEKSLLGARAYDLGTWAALPGRLRRASEVAALVTHVLPLTEVRRAFELVATREGTKVLLTPDG